MTSLYRSESTNHKWDAQRNLAGRSHYVDDGTLRWHKSRVVYSDILADGLGYLLVESYAVDSDNYKRAFRGVVFDVFGYIVYRPDLDQGFNTSQKALDATMLALKEINFHKATLAGIDRQDAATKSEHSYLRGILKERSTP